MQVSINSFDHGRAKPHGQTSTLLMKYIIHVFLMYDSTTSCVYTNINNTTLNLGLLICKYSTFSHTSLLKYFVIYIIILLVIF